MMQVQHKVFVKQSDKTLPSIFLYTTLKLLRVPLTTCSES